MKVRARVKLVLCVLAVPVVAFVVYVALSVSKADFYPLAKMSPVAADFLPLQGDPRVLYKPDVQAQAILVQRTLDEQIVKIEKVHGKPFTKPITVHVCDTAECFSRYTGLTGVIAAVTSNGLFLRSYVIDNEDYGIWLGHELSHLHLFQQISIFDATFIPQWYHDGLATFASGGGGATKVSESEALSFWLDGSYILAPTEGAFFSTRWPRNYEASSDAWFQQHLDYRQAAMFYRFLHDKGGVNILRLLESGQKFSVAFRSVFARGPNEMLQEYVQTL